VKTYTLKTVASVIRGVTFSKAEGSPVPMSDSLPVIRAGSIQQTLLLGEGQIWVPAKKISTHQLIRKNDIVMCTSSGSSELVGKCAKSTQDWNGSFGAFCAGIRTDESKCNSSYLYHFLCSPHFRNWTKTSSGANIKNIRVSELASFEIPLPPLEEQKRIAAILDKADAIRRKRQQAIDLTDQLLRSVFLDMFGDPVTNPKGFDVAPLGTLVKALEGGKNIKPDESGRPACNRVLKVSAVTSGIYRSDESKPLPDDYEPPASYFVKKGDLLISRANTSELIGATAFVYDTPNNMVLPDKIWRFVWKNAEKIHPLFIHYLLKQAHIRREIRIRSSGTSGSMKNIPKPKLLEISIPIPSVTEQNKFGEIVNKIQGTYKNHNTYKEEMNNFFNSLTKSAFSGELTKQTKAA